MRTLLATGAFVALAALAGSASAHHSTNLNYDVNKTVTFEAVFKDMQYLNPHSIMHFYAKDSSGADVLFSGETHPISMLNRAGWRPGMFQPGEKLTLKGNPPRDAGRNAIHLLFVTEPNGKTWSVNSGN